MKPDSPPPSRRGRRVLGLFALCLGLAMLAALMVRSCARFAAPPRIDPHSLAP